MFLSATVPRASLLVGVQVRWVRECGDCGRTEAHPWGTGAAASLHELVNIKNIHTEVFLASAAGDYPAT